MFVIVTVTSPAIVPTTTVAAGARRVQPLALLWPAALALVQVPPSPVALLFPQWLSAELANGVLFPVSLPHLGHVV